MKTRFLPSLLFSLSLALPAQAGDLAAPSAAPREVLARFNDGLGFCAQTAFRHRGTVPSLDRLFDDLQVSAVQAVFRPSDQTRRLAAGSPSLAIETLRREHRRTVRRLLAERPRSGASELPELFHIYRFELGSQRDPGAVAGRLRQDPRVVFAEVNHIYRSGALPGDPFVDGDGDGAWESGTWEQPYADLWGLEAIGWGRVWEQRSTLWPEPSRVGGGGITVAVVDTGVDLTHEDLLANLWRDGAGNAGRDTVDIDLQAYLDRGFVAVDGEDYTDPDFLPEDRNGHGTHVSGTIAAVADNGIGIAGVAWNSSLMTIRAGFAISTSGGGNLGLLESDDIAAGLVWAADHGADVINMSFGGVLSETIATGLEYAAGLGVFLVASAGNSAQDAADSFPASHPSVMAVGAVGPSGDRARFSNYGRSVSLVAPGVDILSLRAQGTALTGEDEVVGSSYIRSDGTSMAAPHVAGAAALALAAYPALDAAALGRRLEGTSRDHGLTTLASRSRRQAFGVGGLDLLELLKASPRPVLKLISIGATDPLGHPENNGNNVAESAETISFDLGLENVWIRAQGRVRLELTSDDPYIQVLQGTAGRFGWPLGNSFIQRFSFSVAPGVPPLHRTRLELRVRGEGWSQELTVPVEINPPAPFAISLDNLDPPPGDANLVPQVASSAAGGTVTVWLRQLFGEPATEIRARLLDPRGRLLGDDILVETGGPFGLSGPAVDRTADGRFAVVWADLSDADARALVGRLFDADGEPTSPLLELDDDPARPPSGRFSVAMGAGGGFAVAWTAGAGSADSDVLLRRFAPDGSPLGPSVPATTASGSQTRPSMTRLEDGGVVVVWNQSPGIHLLAQRFDAAGQRVRGEVRINQAPGSFDLFSHVAPLRDGGFVVVWKDCTPPSEGLTCTVKSRAFDGSDQPLGDESTVSEGEFDRILSVSVASSSMGGLAAWDSCLAGSTFVSTCGVLYRSLGPSGEPAGEIRQVPEPGGPLFPDLSAGGSGFLLAWDDQDGRPSGSFAQVVPEIDTGVPTCDPGDPRQLCLRQGRFRIQVDWKHHAGHTGVGRAVDLTDQSGGFWFFRPGNIELVVKVLDGRTNNGHWWVFSASLSNVDYTLSVTDTETGAVKVYRNPRGTLASFGDTRAFPEEPPAASPATTAPSAAGTLRTALPAPVAPPGGATETETCTPDPETLCLNGSRFSLTIQWTDPRGNTGSGQAVALTSDSGFFTFFNDQNIEVVAKVLDGREVNGRWWVFYASLSNVEYTLTVTDRETGAVKTYTNPAATFASAADLMAF